jgi:NAD(P)H-hydrate repair Nnr-like enzyme with NAD(P)H-hydrate dehydratase domain
VKSPLMTLAGGRDRHDRASEALISALATPTARSRGVISSATTSAGQGFALVTTSSCLVLSRVQAACAAATLNGSAGGKAQSGNSSMISLALANMPSTPVRKLMTKIR